MTKESVAPKQQELFDTRSVRLEALQKENPIPETKELAEEFLRKRTGAQITMKKDHDLLRVVLKTTDCEEDQIKFEKKVELPLDDPEEHERKFIATAVEAYEQWLRLEQEKL